MPHDAATEAAPGRWLGFAALAGGLALVVLDGTVVAVSLPAIVDGLRLSMAEGEWLTTLYAMVFAALLLTFGRLADRHGRRLLFQIGVVVFLGASLWAAAAGGAGDLIAARALQGVGGALVLPSSLSSVNATFRGADRSRAFGLWGAIMAGAAAIGPVVGGWLTSAIGWRAIFLVNLPLGAAVLALTRHLPESADPDERDGFDLPGLLTSALGFGLLVFALVEGWFLGWWRPADDLVLGPVTWPASAPVGPIPVALMAGVALTGAFLALERHRARAGQPVLLDLSLFSIPTFAWGNLTAATVAVGEFALLFVVPLFLVFALRLSVLQAGLVVAAMALGAFVAGAQARHLAARLGAPRVVTLGLLIELAAAGGLAVALGVRPDPWAIAALLAGYGLGLGLAAAQLTATVLRDVPPARSGVAAATQSTARQLGSALGAATAGAALAAGFVRLVPPALQAVPGVSTDDSYTMVDYMVRSAGGVIGWIRDRGTEGHFGALGPRVADVMSDVFAVAAGWATWTAAAFLALGVVGALVVERASRTSLSAASEPRKDAARPTR